MLHLLLANLKMMVRDRQALFWALVFPLIFVTIFGLFDLDQPGSATVAVIDHAQDGVSRGIIDNLGSIEFLSLDQDYSDEATARRDLQEGNGDIDFVLVIPPGLEEVARAGSPQGQAARFTLLYDAGNLQTSQVVIGVIRQFLEQVNLELAGAPRLLELDTAPVQARQVDYFDFLLPGFVGMGVMTYAIIGMASNLALYREKKILKRILATPLSVRTFFTAQVLAYLVLSLVQAAIILAAGVFIFGGRVYGNLAWLFLVVLLGNLIFLNLGFLVSIVARTLNAANGLANAIAMPMLFLSGVFFPLDSLPRVLAVVFQYLPLTPMLDVMRGVVIDARVPWAYPAELAILAGWIVGTSLLVVRFFRFD